MNEFAIIAGMALATFLTRYPMMLLVSKIELSQRLKSTLKYVPIAVLSAIIAPLVLLRDGQLNITISNSFLLAGIVAIFISWRTRNLLLTIVLGMLTMWSMQFLIG